MSTSTNLRLFNDSGLGVTDLVVLPEREDDIWGQRDMVLDASAMNAFWRR
jgi:hypothetical protein